MRSYPTLNFDLGDTADLLRDTVKSFADVEIAPRAANDLTVSLSKSAVSPRSKFNVGYERIGNLR